MSLEETLSVGELTQYLRELLEGNPSLRGVKVEGEVSNLTRHSSGHVYFTLKDDEAQLSCAMFKGAAIRYYSDMPKQGDRIIVRGDIKLYPPQGRYQLIATSMEKAGQGDLHRRFIELKERLEKEGLFSPARKRNLPKYPQTIGIVTSPTGAVIKDIINTVRRRFPHVKLLLSPANVQGEAAVLGLIHALEILQKRNEVEVIILARGGGSLEDLWCFNDERLIRAISACKIPVVTGIGHETDFTIADFVADVRASTPTAAAELVLPNVNDLKQFLNDSAGTLKRNLRHFIDFRRQLIDDFEGRMISSLDNKLDEMRRDIGECQAEMLGSLEWMVNEKRHELVSLQNSMAHSMEKQMNSARHDLEMLGTMLNALDMTETLKRGYTVTMLGKARIIDANQLSEGQIMETHFAKGSSISEVKKVNKK